MGYSTRRRSKKPKGQFKSRLEKNFAAEIFKRGLKAEYEAKTFAYIRKSHYTPDWKIGNNSFIETKGYLSPSNRSNLLSFKEQYPAVTIHIAFQNASNRLNAKSKTTYGEWAEKNGFKWCDLSEGFPEHWFEKKVKKNNENHKSSN